MNKPVDCKHCKNYETCNTYYGSASCVRTWTEDEKDEIFQENCDSGNPA